MNLSQFAADLLYLFTWALGDFTVLLLGAFLAAAIFYALAVVVSYIIRSRDVS